jgi:hypothetical protein
MTAAMSGALFASLALVGLAFILLARGYSVSVLGLGLAGLLALAMASTWMTLAASDADKIPELQRRIAGLEAENAKLQGENATLNSDNRRASRQSEPAQLVTASQAGAPCDPTPNIELQQARREVAALATQKSRLEGDLQAERSRSESFARTVKELEAKAGAIKQAPAQAIRARLEEGPGFASVTQSAAPVADHDGSWYSVRLVGRNGRPILFSPREFAMPDGASQTAELGAGIARLNEEVLRPLGPARAQLFVRGGADLAPITKPTKAPPAPFKVVVRRGGRYDLKAIREHAVPAQFANEDLPNLRAHWMAKEIERRLGLAEVPVLDNRPEADGERVAEILLHVRW